MANAAPHETITLVIGQAEAFILFELLCDFYKESSLQVNDNAERLALVRLHGSLESTLVEPFDPDYHQIITAARNDLTEQWGDPGTQAIETDNS